MIQSQRKPIPVHVDPISFMSDISVLNGNLSQTYNKETNEYEADRTLVPLILMPWVNVSDPEKIMNGKAEITGVEYYEGAPKSDASNRIIDCDDYKISADNCPKYSLKCMKNVQYDSAFEIHAIYSFIDKRTNIEQKVERSVPLKTTIYDSTNYSLKIAQPKQFTVDPTRIVPDDNGNWKVEIPAQLFSGKLAIDDEKVAYFWQWLNDGVWTDINPDEDVFCTSVKTDGKWRKVLELDARCFKNISIRCIGVVYTGAYPTNPTNSEISDTTTIKVEMPQTLRAEIVQTKGVKITSSMTTPLAFACMLYDNNKKIEDYSLFQIAWKIKPSNTTNDIIIGYGKDVEFNLKDLGLSVTSLATLRAEVKMYREHAVVCNADNVLTNNDKILINKIFE